MAKSKRSKGKRRTLWDKVQKREAYIIVLGVDACPLRGGPDPLPWSYCPNRVDGDPCEHWLGLLDTGMVCKHQYANRALKKALTKETKKIKKTKEPKPPSEQLTPIQEAMQQALFNL